MAPKPAADVLDAAPKEWFEAADNYEDEVGKAKARFLELRGGLPAKEVEKDGRRRAVPEAAKFLDDAFTTEPHPAPCWFIGGRPSDDRAAEGPHAWERISDLHASPEVFSPKKYSCLVQGGSTDGYLCEAMQAIAMREHLVKRLIPETFDVERGLYVVMLYKNACWTRVTVDDYIPVDDEGVPECCTTYAWPSVCWPAIVEKAYAKRHGSYEGISGGGSVAEALVDLTGGVAGVFGVRAVAADRLFTYVHELQMEALFVARVDTREIAKPNVRLTARAPYVINRAMGHEGGKFFQICCPGIAGGPFDDDIPDSLLHSRFFPEKASDGFFWVRVEQFQQCFAEIIECRLVANDNLDDIKLFGQPVPRSLAMQRPISHRLYATLGVVRASHAPEFRIHLEQAAAPCEVFLMVSQDDVKLAQKDYDITDRTHYVPLVVRVYQKLPGKMGGCAKIAQSCCSPARDAFVSFKAVRAAEFFVRVTMPVGTAVEKLILRCDTTARAPGLELFTPVAGAATERHTWLEPKEPLAGFQLSFVGRSTPLQDAEKGKQDAETSGGGLNLTRAYIDGYGWPRGHQLAAPDGECAVQ